MLWRRIHLPVEMVVGKDAFRRGACVIDGRNAQVTQGARRIVAAGGLKNPNSRPQQLLLHTDPEAIYVS